MKGIVIQGGATFVEQDGVTVRILHGKCELSPVLLGSLEWELRTEPPDTWDYLTESDIRGLGEELFSEIERIVNEVKRV